MSAVTKRERGILFSDRLVRAILDGRKTQTRRVCRTQPRSGHQFGKPTRWVGEDGRKWFVYAQEGDWWFGRCPYGVPGDRLYVREAHAFSSANQPIYRADYPANCEARGMENIPPLEDVRWKPSIHMPKWASRIWLEITGVRVERVQEITDEDAVAEGVEPGTIKGRATNRFRSLWDQTNAHRPGCSWNDNPWVWVIEFRRIDHG